jgi:hypothetical protein
MYDRRSPGSSLKARNDAILMQIQQAGDSNGV